MPSHIMPILSNTDSISMQSHCHSSVGIAGMNEVLGHIEVVSYNISKGIIGCLVGIVRSPIGQCQHLFLRDVVCEQRTVMTLHRQLVAAAIGNDMGLHTVAHEQVTHLW